MSLDKQDYSQTGESSLLYGRGLLMPLHTKGLKNVDKQTQVSHKPPKASQLAVKREVTSRLKSFTDPLCTSALLAREEFTLKQSGRLCLLP